MSDIDFPVPSEAEVEKAVKAFSKPLRDYTDTPPNLAGKKELVKKVHELSKQYFDRYSGQSSRGDLETFLKDCDAKYRMAQAQAQAFKVSSTQEHDTLSHVASSQFYKSVHVIASGQKSIIFSDPEGLPVEYSADYNCGDYTDEEGKRIAREQNLYLDHVWTKQGWTRFIKSVLQLNQKNSMVLLSCEWDYKIQKRTERFPGYYNSKGEAIAVTAEAYANNPPAEAYKKDGDKLENPVFNESGSPMSYVFVEKERVVKNCPVLEKHDLAHSYFDLDIDDPQKWPYLHLRKPVPYAELLDQEIAGFYKNVGKLTTAQMYESNSKYGSQVDNDRDDNADQTRDEVKNGLYERHHTFILAPIDEDGKWDDDVIPEYYECVWAGNFDQLLDENKKNDKGEKVKGDGCVCLQLRKLPYHHKRLPYYLMHSHDDERGALKMGIYTLLECNIEEQTETLNQHIDNKNLKIFRPWFARKGDVLSRDLKFKNRNQVVWIDRSVSGDIRNSLVQAEVDDMTQTTLPLLEWLQKDADETVPTTDAYKGVFGGSRTTGTEYLGAREQSMKPAIEDTEFVADPFFKWLLQDVSDLARQCADPDEFIKVAGGTTSINPTRWYGLLNVKVTGIKKFEADVSAKQILINFIQSGAYDKAKEFMGKTGALYFWRTVAKFLRIPDVNSTFPESRKLIEAENQAWSDWKAILADPLSAMLNEEIMPKPDEAHETHLAILQGQRDKFELLPNEDTEYKTNVLSAVDLYILMHKQFMEKEQMPAGQVAPMAGQGTPPTMGGEAAGDVLSGLAGQVAEGV